MSAHVRSGLDQLRQSLVVQGRVIFALLMREILTRYGRHNIGFLWLFLEPMIFTLGITALWTATGAGHHSSLPITAFAVTGYSSVLLWRNMPGRAIGAIEPNASLMYHRNVKPLDIFLARLVLEAMGATTSFVTLGLFFSAIGWMDLPEDVLQVVGGWLMLAWFGSSLAILLGALQESSELVEKIWHPAAYLLFPLSGAASLVSALPERMQSVVLWFPMVHGVEYVREGYFGSKVDATYDMPYMLLCNIILTFLGLIQLRRIAGKVIPQ